MSVRDTSLGLRPAPATVLPVTSQRVLVWRRFRRNKAGVVGLTLIALVLVLAVGAPVLIPYENAIDQDLASALQGPSLTHPLGMDDLGRDMLARILWGSRLSLSAGIVAVSISLALGALLGTTAGFYGGPLDSVIMRVMDVMLAVPSILLALAIVSVQGAGIVDAMIAVGIAAIPGYARLVRSVVLNIRDVDFVLAARCIGQTSSGIVWRHIFPNAVGIVIVRATLGISEAILATAALGFLGMGSQPPTPEWGAMLSGARDYVSSAPLVVTVPGVAIAITVLAFNLAGDGLRDALDPRTSHGRI
jgi:peptide/nickel transport system permease protein